jgi:hypothetical protein
MAASDTFSSIDIDKARVRVPRISHSGAFATLGMQVFVSITTVLCQLVQCTRVGSDDVLFIQGTEPCHTPLRSFLIFAIAVLFSLPFAVAFLLWKNRLPKAARASLCCAFTPSAYLWNTALLAYRLIMGTVFVFNEVPSTRAIILMMIKIMKMMIMVTIMITKNKNEKQQHRVRNAQPLMQSWQPVVVRQ